VLLGVDQVRRALQAGEVVCVVVASDTSPRASDKVVRLARSQRVPLLAGPPAAVIGARLGRPAVMVAGVLDRALARGLAEASAGSAPREA
jgi:ribosomal protein L7Ae-like RNA K-turn-binding protein